MRKLLRYLKHYKKESIIGPLFKLLEACFELIVPLVMANIIDIGIKNQDMPYIWKMGAVLVLFGVLGLACSLTAQYYAMICLRISIRYPMQRWIRREARRL